MTKRKMIKASKVKLPWADKPTIYPNKKDPLHLLAMLSEHTKYNVVVTPINKSFCKDILPFNPIYLF
jgi:hypothetical protein